MKTIMKAWKATINGLSWSSCRLGPEYLLYYKVGETTIPKIGKIFVFKEKEEMLSFISFSCINYDTKYVKVFYGEASNAKHIKYLSHIGPSHEDNIVKFWSAKKRYKLHKIFTDHAPTGTLICDSFTPKKEYTLDQLKNVKKEK